ncbi:hypothetical protein MKEN_00949200 [Mycena kentingensis (nom. inval.)]|nr:hypothetical protein MKEN_00949200 [Mycena kentingensis (nom. inval.)]
MAARCKCETYVGRADLRSVFNADVDYHRGYIEAKFDALVVAVKTAVIIAEPAPDVFAAAIHDALNSKIPAALSLKLAGLRRNIARNVVQRMYKEMAENPEPPTSTNNKRKRGDNKARPDGDAPGAHIEAYIRTQSEAAFARVCKEINTFSFGPPADASLCHFKRAKGRLIDEYTRYFIRCEVTGKQVKDKILAMAKAAALDACQPKGYREEQVKQEKE